MRARTSKKTFFLGALMGFLLFAGFLAVTMWLTSAPSLAVTVNPNLGNTLGLGSADLESTVIKILQWALGFLGLVAVIIIMYGGFVWLTAAGNEEKIKKAKRILRDAIIGLIIILLAWAIVTFIIGRLNNIINSGQKVCTTGDVNGCYTCNAQETGYTDFHGNWPGCHPDGTETFHMKWVDPGSGETDVPLCSIVQAQYNGDFDPATVVRPNVGLFVDAATKGDGAACANPNECRSGVCTTGACVGNDVAGTWQVATSDQSLLEFLPSANFLSNTTYRADITTGVREAGGTPRTTVPTAWTFTTGTTTLTTPPTVTKIYPADNAANICLNTPIQTEFSQKMRAASVNTSTVTYRNITDNLDAQLRSPFSVSNGATLFTTRPASPMTPGKNYSVTLTAGTADKNNPDYKDPAKGVMDVCLNHLDGNYNSAENGSPADNFMSINGHPNATDTSPWNFVADTDTTNTRCIPEITSINPPDGRYTDPAPGVQINGTNFGIGGNVVFNREVNDDSNCFRLPTDIPPDPPGSPLNWPVKICNVSWTGTRIQTRIPGGPVNYGDIIPSNGARDGGVTVRIVPGVCEGGSKDNQSCNTTADCPGGTCVTDSNAVGFDVTSPQIGDVSGLNSQPHGGIGQYVTVIKRNDANAGFGDTPGQVFFRNRLSGAEVVAEFPPDPPCKATWTDRYAIIKVPDLSAIATACTGNWATCPNTNSEVAVQVVRADGTRSNLSYFIYTNEDAGPGLCQVQPICGTQGTAVTLSGEKFTGPNPHSVTFKLGTNPPVTVGPTSWTDTVAGANVPNLNNAEDPYKVNVTNGNGASNAMPFDVPCGGIPKVSESTSCSFTCTGGPNNGKSCNDPGDCPSGQCLPSAIPSPNPYKGTADVCLNAVFGATFTAQMTNATLNNTNIKFYDCTDNTSACATTNEIVIPPANFTTFAPPNNTRFTFAPPANLTKDHYYKVIIIKEVRSATNVKMVSDYSWIVKTQTGDAACPVSRVLVSPSNATLTTLGARLNYSSMPMGPNCMYMNPANYVWNWNSTVPAVASVLQQVPPYTAQATSAAQGLTAIQATTEGKTGQGSLRVSLDSCAFDPTVCNKSGLCPGSVCDIARDRCTPVIADQNGDGQALDPVSGPRGQTVTIEGCYFGRYVAGSSQVLFSATHEGLFLCQNPWTDRQIVTTVPDSVPLGTNSVEVQTADNFNTRVDSGQTNITFDATNLCNGGAQVPGTGVPGLCQLSPLSDKIGSHPTFTGYNFTLNGGYPAVKSEFSQQGGGYTNSAGNSGTSDATGKVFSGSTVPNNAAQNPPGPARIAVADANGNYCPSNGITFGVTCSANAECATGCCAYSDVTHSKICQATAVCSSGAPGTACQLPTNNPLCQSGPLVTATDYRCIDTVGHRDPNNPAGAAYPVPAPDASCITCCYPGQTNAGNLSCVTNKGTCTGANRGLYCGCTPGNDPRCGNTNSYACGTDTCCHGRPTLAQNYPTPAPGPVQCLNIAIEYQFSEAMDMATISLGTSVVITENGAPKDGAIVKKNLGFVFNPKAPFIQNATIQAVLHTDQIKSQKGIAVSGTAGDSITSQWTTGTATVCKIDRVAIEFTKNSPTGPFAYPSPDLFICILNGCTDDLQKPLPNGNQHSVAATAYDKAGNQVTANYTWSVADSTIVQLDPTQQLTAQNKNGRTAVSVLADPVFFTGGEKSASATVRVNACEHPWPNTFAPEFDTFPYTDNVTHFSISYCRDPGTLPLLVRSTGVIVKPGSYQTDNGKNELIREFFFTRAGTDDAIGIRVYEDEGDRSPRDWYYNQFGPAAPEPQDLTIDGYAAVRAGRSVYVGALNVLDNIGLIYPDIYLISYNEGASDDTVSIYNRLIENWEFNINILPDNKAKLQRDLKRISDLSGIYDKLVKYRTDKGIYPKLEGGSYVKMLSTSKWPSWQQTLGAALGGNLPVDPIDKFAVPDATLCTAANRYDQNTCWSDSLKRYECPTDSHVYQYIGSADGSQAWLATRLELIENFVGLWWLGPETTNQNPCLGMPEATCNCFNYIYNVTGSAVDHAGPVIGNVDSLVYGGTTTLAGTRALDVTVSDVGTGVSHVEFYVDGTLKFNDTDSGSWSWSFNTTQFADGSHTVRVRAYDNAGNLTDKDFKVNIDNASQPDTTPPFVTITTPADGTTVSNRNVTYSSDKDAPASGAKSIEVTSSGSLFWIDYPGAKSSINRYDSGLAANTQISTLNFPNIDPQLNLQEGPNRIYWVRQDKSNGDMLVTYTSNAPGDLRKIVRYSPNAGVGDPPKAIYYIKGVINGVPIPGWDPIGITHAVGASNGKIIAVNYFRQLVIFNPTTGLTEKFLNVCPGACIGGIDTDAAGNIYVTRNTSVYKYSPDLVEIGHSTMAGLNFAIGLDVVGNTMYIANQGTHDIVAMDTDLTKLVHVFGQTGVPGSDLSHLRNPDDVVLNGNNLYIADTNNGRIVRVRALISYGVQINALATDNRQVSSVALTISNGDSYTCSGNTSSTLSCSFAPPWDTTQVPNGQYTITATATDAGGRTGTTSIKVNVDNLDPVPPQVAFNDIGGKCAEGICQDSNPAVACDYANPCASGKTCIFAKDCTQSNTTTQCTNNFNNQMCLRSGTVTVPVTATDNKQVNAVKFYVDGIFKGDGIPATPPPPNIWNWSWDTRGYTKGVCTSTCQAGGQACVGDSDCPQAGDRCVAVGGRGVECNETSTCQAGLTCAGHQVTAYAYDDAGNVATSTAFIPVDVAQDDSQAPTVVFVPPTPSEGTAVDQNITIRVLAQDNYGVNRVNFYLDHVLRTTTLAGQPTEWVVDTTAIPDGWHSFQVDALDARGNRSTSIEHNYNVRGPGGPKIENAFITPDTGPVGTVYTIYADISDFDGADPASIIAPIQSPDEVDLQPTAVNISLARISGDQYSGRYRGTWTSDRVDALWVDIQARDVQGNASELENIPGRAACNNNGICEDPIETNATCPADCPPNIPVITSILSASGQVGTAFTYQITASNGPTSFNATGLPNGLSVNTTTGLMAGTPAAGSNNTYTVPITATNGFGSDTKNLTLVIQGACVATGAGPCTGATGGAQNCCSSNAFCSHMGTKTNPNDDKCVTKYDPPKPCDYSFWCTTDWCSNGRCT